tara:strand:- start:222 stop:917 length:696 start_codon:yes stop_codon:yes gene_type:complete
MGKELTLAYKPPTIGDSWRAFKYHLGTFVGIYLIMFILAIISNVILEVFTTLISALGDYSEGAIYLGIFLGLLFNLPFSIVNNLFGISLLAVPSIYYSTEEVISFNRLINIFKSGFWRYVFAGVFWTLAIFLGILFCFIPGIILSMMTPIYVHKIFTTNLTILESFKNSWSSLFNSGKAPQFFGVSILVGLVTVVATILTCGIGGLIVIPMAWFYIFNYASHIGVIKYSNN